MKWEFGTAISIVIGIAGLTPLVIVPIKNDYRKLMIDSGMSVEEIIEKLK